MDGLYGLSAQAVVSSGVNVEYVICLDTVEQVCQVEMVLLQQTTFLKIKTLFYIYFR